MKIVEELNEYFGTNVNTVDEFEKYFRYEYYSHDYSESLLEFIKNCEKRNP